MNPTDAFGKVLQATRLARQLSQLELAEAADLDRTFISLLERGQRQPSLNTIFALCSALEVLPSEMIADIELHLRLRKGKRKTIPSRRL